MMRNTAYQKRKENTQMLKAQCKNMGKKRKHLESYNVQKYKKN